ncbi:MAG: phage tail protein [Lachnospiraceae bacterium]|nr:phage tail protein [Lachnospiraceae bacterium]
MSASQDDLIGVYEFEVQLGLMINLSFSKISGISRSGEVGIIGDGGDNDSMHFYLKPRRKPDVIRFEKGWATGMEATMMSWLTEGLVINDIMIIVKQNGSMNKILSIDKAVLSRITYSDLDALRGDIMIKSMELQHTGV